MDPSSHLTLLQALFLAVTQGTSELFPVSSLGHAVVLPYLLGWNVDREAPSFLPFLVSLHLGTAIALALYFWRDWLALLGSIVGRGGDAGEVGVNRYLLLLLVVGTVPAGLLGLLLEKRLAALFGSVQLVAVALILNGLLLAAGEWLRRRERYQELGKLRPWQAFAIGTVQAIALVPGFSRSGASMVGGLLVGLTHQAAARFAFLLSTPIIGAAALLEMPKLLSPDLRGELGLALLAGLVAGVVAYGSTALLMRYFKTHEVNALAPFAVYCLALGALTLVVR